MIVLVVIASIAIGLIGGWIYAGFPLPNFRRVERVVVPTELRFEEIVT